MAVGLSVTLVSPPKGQTDQDAVWVEDSVGSREPCIRWDAHWRHLANANEPSMCGGDASFLSNYFDHLFTAAVM